MKLRRLIMVPAVAVAFLGAAALGTPNSANAAPLASNDSLHAIADVSFDGAQSAVWAERGITNEAPMVNDHGQIRRRRASVIISTGGGIVFPTGVVVRSTNNCNGVLARRVVVRRIVVRTNNCDCNAVASNVIVRRTVVRPTVIIIRSGHLHRSTSFVSSGLRFR